MSMQTLSASRAVIASGTSGAICQKTGPYSYNNGFLDIIVFVKSGDPFPSSPAILGSTSEAKTDAQTDAPPVTWSMVRGD